MRNRTVVLLLAFGLAGTAGAASQRTFVASYGVDTNSCSLAQPCRQFARALTQTLAGGEIIVLDSAGYGAVNIAQDVSIIAPPGIYAGITVFAGATGVFIYGGAKVKLRGLTLNGQGGNVGIFVNGAAEVDIADCEISGMVNDGFDLYGNARLSIRDSRFLNNGGYGISYGGDNSSTGSFSFDRVVVRGNATIGISVDHVTGMINGSTIEGNGTGGMHSLQAYLNVRDSTVAKNGGIGVSALDGYLRIERSTVSVNGSWGIKLWGAAQGWIVNNVIYDNQQASAGTSQVCACDATAAGYVSGNALHGTVIKAFDAIGPIYTFGDNRTVKLMTGSINPVGPQ